jgi:hypothetical protein
MKAGSTTIYRKIIVADSGDFYPSAPVSDTEQIIQDTLYVDDSETDTTEIPDPEWTFITGLTAQNNQVQRGVNLSTNAGIITCSNDIYHKSGLNAGLDFMQRVGSISGFQGWVGRLNYTCSFSESIEGGIQYTHFGYNDINSNPVAALPNMISLNLSGYGNGFIWDISLDRALGQGTESASYLTLSGMKTIKLDSNFKLIPMISISGTRSEIETKKQIRKKTESTKTVTGLSMISFATTLRYMLSEQIALVATPSILYTPQKGISANDFQFNFSIGLRYVVEWY